MKIYIFVCAYDDGGLDVEVQGVYKSREQAIDGMLEYFVKTCDYEDRDAKEIANELLSEQFYDETGEEFAVKAVYRLEIVEV